MLRLDANLSDNSDDQSSDSIASGGMTPRREKPVTQRPLPTQRNRPKSATPYGRPRYSLSGLKNASEIHPNLLPPITSSPALGRTLPTLEDEESPSPMFAKRIQVKRSMGEANEEDEGDDTLSQIVEHPKSPCQRYHAPSDSPTALPPMFHNSMPSPIPRREALSPLNHAPKTSKPKKNKANKNKIGSEPLPFPHERRVPEGAGRPLPKVKIKPKETETVPVESNVAMPCGRVTKVKLAVILGFVACGLVIVGLIIGIIILLLDKNSS